MLNRESSLALCVCLLAGAAAAQDSDVKAAMPVLLKVLTYDANFDARGAGDFVVLVVSDPGAAGRRAELVESLKALSVDKVKARPLKYASGDFKDEEGLQVLIDKAKASAILISPGTSAAGVKAVSEVAQDNQLYALALDVAMVEKAIPLGVAFMSGKPQIVINEKAAKAVGVRFESSVLKLARVVQ